MIINIKKNWWALILLLMTSYPVSAWAADEVLKSGVLPAPFLLSWLGVWVFALFGGVGAGFVRIPEIDARFYYPFVAKTAIGLFSGVAICSLIDNFTNTQVGALAFFSFFASIFSAPLIAGVMVWLSNQRRINQALDQVARVKAGIDTSVDEQTGSDDK